MSPNDDDLSAFTNDPLVRALTGPGTAEELAGEAEALAAFKAAVPIRARRRFAGRVGVAGGALGLAVVLSGGVAAAYTGSLPAPAQGFFHDLLKPVGFFDPPDAHHSKLSTTAADPHVSPTVLPPSPQPTATLTSAHPATKSTPRKRSHPTIATKPSPTPSPSSSPTPAPTPTPTPTPTNTAPVPSDSITISLSETTVAPGQSVTVYGQLATSNGDPVAGQNVWLLETVAGVPGVTQVDSGTTGSDGSVTFSTPPLSHNVRLRLVTRTKVDSAAITVIVEPSLTVSVTPGSTLSTVEVSSNGGDPGDVINLLIRRDGTWQPFASSQLDSTGSASFGVTPPTGARDQYEAVLPRTNAHGLAVTHFTVPPS